MHNNADKQPTLIFEENSRLGLIQLNHTAVGNPLTTASMIELTDKLYSWVEDPEIYAVIFQSAIPDFFSTGSDQSEILSALEESPELADQHFAKQYQALWKIECYTKPFIQIINGKVSGSAAALSQFGTHLIAGENFRLSLPAVKQGFFPGAGISHILANLPHSMGQFLALTGRDINRGDAVYLGLVEHAIDSLHFGDIANAFKDAEPIDPILDGLNQEPEPSELEKYQQVISRTFNKTSIEAILEALGEEKGEYKEWAETVSAELSNLRELSLKVTLSALSKATKMTADENLITDYRLVRRFLRDAEYRKGLSATVAGNPATDWGQSALNEVATSSLEEYFTVFNSSDLELPPRELGVDK